MAYFSDREGGEKQPVSFDVPRSAWAGLRSLIRSRQNDGSFGYKYPELCSDSPHVIGTDTGAFNDALLAQIPDLGGVDILYAEEPPPIAALMDLLEFCWSSVGLPLQGNIHPFFGHHHLSFDHPTGAEVFRKDVNAIFARNGIAFQMSPAGQIERRLPLEFAGRLERAQFNTGDPELDIALVDARRKIKDPDPVVQREAVERLWDAFERLKTLLGDKKASITTLLDNTAAGNTTFRAALEKEAKELTDLGNSLQIRHWETKQERISDPAGVDYLFQRLFALISTIAIKNNLLS